MMRGPDHSRVVLWALVLGLAWGHATRSCRAHEGPEHEIEEITELIETRGESAHLLLERAVEYQVLGRLSEAARDLSRASELDPGSIHVRRELARVEWLEGKADAAVETLTRAARLEAPDPADLAGVFALRAEILRSQGHWRRALDDCEKAIAGHGANPEWYLLRSDLQHRLGRERKRVEGLEEGLRRTGAGILVVERIEALLDAGRYREALAAVEPELASARLQGRWLIRRGRARLGLGDRAAGEGDLRAGLEEIDRRLDRQRPDTTLLWDRAMAQLALGDREAARQTYAWARDRGGNPDLAERLRVLVADPEPKRRRR